MPMDYGAIGIGGGLLAPLLYKLLFGKDNPQNTGSAGTPATSASMMGRMGAATTPTVDINNPSTEVLRQAQLMFPGSPANQLPDYVKANPEMFKYGAGMGNPAQPAAGGMPSTQDAMAAMQAMMGGSNKPAGGSDPLSSRPIQMGVPVQQPNYGGSGPTPGSLAAMSPQSLAMSMQLPNGGVGAPLGYAANNPLLALLRNRLGVV